MLESFEKLVRMVQGPGFRGDAVLLQSFEEQMH